MRTTTPLALAAALLLVSACAADGGDAAPPAAQAPACAALYGQPVDAGVFDAGCVRPDGGLHFYGAASYDCADGRKLYWNDLGWGWSDGVLQRHARPDGQLVPPDPDRDACLG